ncbi:serine/threonine-protein kinase [Actinoplanes sp. CA-142083]|uniref:serine/threonine-protein kinase n=1 Tax=Actinoplanes sp. CA-142083 TaxID=3239903 RepID=UPI003D8C8D2B
MDVDLAGLARPGLCLGGRYRLVEAIGAGGMAVVWRSWDTVLTRTVAVKLLATHQRDPRLAQIRREARIAAQLSHPNIAQVYDYGESVVSGELVPCVVLELITGGTLLDRLRDGDLPAARSLRICAEVASALAAAHAAGLVHRDIKPANIMLAPTGAKVVDFGIAATRGPGADGNAIFGTPTYTAPERLTGDEVLPASDVYALGMLLYRLLSGQAPWAGSPPQRVLANHLHAEPPPLVPLAPVPDEVLELCARCLRKDPNERPTAHEAAQLLSAAADAGAADVDAAGVGAAGGALPSGPGAAEPSTDIQEPARKASRVVLYLIAAGIVLAIATTAGWLVTRGAPAEPAPPPAAVARPPTAGATSPPAARGSSPPPAATAPPALGPTLATTPRPAGTQGTIAGLPAPTTTPPAAPTTTSVPASTTPPLPEPVERTLTSRGGTVTADCPSPATARILSWTPARSYRMEEVDTTPGPSPAATFRHGADVVTMTVTCEAGVPRSEIT